MRDTSPQRHRPPSAPTATYDDDVRLAHVVADTAQAAAMPSSGTYNRQSSSRQANTNESGQQRYQAVDLAIRQVLRRARPRDSILSDFTESSDTDTITTSPGVPSPSTTPLEQLPSAGVSGLLPGTTGARCWLVQPVVGLDHWNRGVPLWGTTLTLLDGPDVVAAVVSFPALNRRWWAAKGSGAWSGRTLTSATSCATSRTQRLDQARLCCGEINQWYNRHRTPTLLALSARCASTHAFGPVWPFLLLAEGGLDVVAHPATSLFEVAAASLIATEAGALFSDLEGNPGPAGGHALAAPPQLHDQALHIISS